MTADVDKGRRRGTETSATRTVLIDAAEQLMCEEGYAAVSARRLASKAGLKPQLVHYYFRTMDDLYVALIRRGGDRTLERLAKALGSQQPLRAIWEVGNDRQMARLSVEFMALANHRKAVRAEVKRYAEQMRIVQAAALTRHFELLGVDPPVTPVTSVLLTSAAAYLMYLEATLGIALGHSETRAFIEHSLQKMESEIGPPRPSASQQAVAGRRRPTRGKSNRPRRAGAAR